MCEEWNGNTLIPMYDNEDSVCGIIYNDEPYYFTKNLQGDIITIVDKNAQTVAKYSYDAWGVCDVTFDCTAIGVATINPYRYRGYFFDKETGLYYLQSRYYDANIGRFVNGDEVYFSVAKKGTLKHNLFAYCENSSITNIDPSGFLVVSIGISLGAAVLLGASISASFLFDFKGEIGIYFAVSVLFGVASKGMNGFLSYYWGFNTVRDYLNGVVEGDSVAGFLGIGFLSNYYESWRSNKKTFVGIQIMFKSTGLYREFSAIEGGKYISLTEELSKECDINTRNIFKIRALAKKIKIRILRKRFL